MFILRTDDGSERIVTSASDLTAASACEFAFLRRVDAKLGRNVAVPADDDPMLARAAKLGDAHEERVLAAYREQFGEGVIGKPGGVVAIERPAAMTPTALGDRQRETREALEAGADLVFQATFFDDEDVDDDDDDDDDHGAATRIAFVGFADFLVRTPSGAYEVQDSKLARRARVTALMQLAAYAEQLERLGVPVAPRAALLLGDGSRSEHELGDIAPVFRARRARLHGLLREASGRTGRDGATATAPPIAWGAAHVFACGRCEVCEPEVQRERDPLLVAGIRRRSRDALLRAGVTTIDALAAAQERVKTGKLQIDGVPQPLLTSLAGQAAAQVGAEGTVSPPVEVVSPDVLGAIPAPDPGDLFFDFEGDPMYRESDTTGDQHARWGLDYLFGMVDTDERFTALWAHDLAAEKQALIDFLALVKERRRAYPGMKIYHYAAYERTHLTQLAARHGVGEDDVDQLLREHVLVDLYPIVRGALRVGTRSYSIKKLEPLYMGDELRDEDGVTSGAQSVTEYAEAREQMLSSDPAQQARGRSRLDAIADYNRYDCVSTLRLRDWLQGLALERGIEPFPPSLPDEGAGDTLDEPSDTARRLLDHAESLRATNALDSVAARLAASAIDYYEREHKAFWWAHFARLIDPVDEWADTRDVMIVDPERSRIDESWFTPPRARVERRHLRLAGEIAPGSSMRGGDVMLIYAYPAPFPRRGAPGARGVRRAKVLSRDGDAVIVEEPLGADDAYTDLPLAIAPGPPPNVGALKGAIDEWGAKLLSAFDRGERPRDPVVDLLRRDPPTLRQGHPLVDPDGAEAVAAAGGNTDARMIGAVTLTLERLDRSTLAVQGPPGTGKTYLAARVIKRLVETRGWRIGVVAQSHNVVENVLDGTVAAGLDPALVAKTPRSGDAGDDTAYTTLPRNGHTAYLRDRERAGSGCVIGGTAWDFSNTRRVGRDELDLLVVDEAGQFSLAPLIAVSVAAKRLLLLGDPQQLPQVSQGSHPEPVDESALGWLQGDERTIPEHLGYFLAETRRMRPELTEVVSELSYEKRLQAHPSAADREVFGGGPAGLIHHPVPHVGNATSSPEEAERVVALAQRLLRSRVSDRLGERRVEPRDVIVVAPYNAQVECVAEHLRAAGLEKVRVGTVDRFQGQEALFSIVTLAASSDEDIPRGLEFLLMRNRLNVALSRAQWAAHLITSDRLGGSLPRSADGMTALSGFLRLTERAQAWDMTG